MGKGTLHVTEKGLNLVNKLGVYGLMTLMLLNYSKMAYAKSDSEVVEEVNHKPFYKLESSVKSKDAVEDELELEEGIDLVEYDTLMAFHFTQLEKNSVLTLLDGYRSTIHMTLENVYDTLSGHGDKVSMSEAIGYIDQYAFYTREDVSIFASCFEKEEDRKSASQVMPLINAFYSVDSSVIDRSVALEELLSVALDEDRMSEKSDVAKAFIYGVACNELYRGTHDELDINAGGIKKDVFRITTNTGEVKNGEGWKINATLRQKYNDTISVINQQLGQQSNKK